MKILEIIQIVVTLLSKLPTKMIILSVYYPYLYMSNIQTVPKKELLAQDHKTTWISNPGFYSSTIGSYFHYYTSHTYIPHAQ